MPRRKQCTYRTLKSYLTDATDVLKVCKGKDILYNESDYSPVFRHSEGCLWASGSSQAVQRFL